MICLLSMGSDPTSSIEALAKRKSLSKYPITCLFYVVLWCLKEVFLTTCSLVECFTEPGAREPRPVTLFFIFRHYRLQERVNGTRSRDPRSTLVTTILDRWWLGPSTELSSRIEFPGRTLRYGMQKNSFFCVVCIIKRIFEQQNFSRRNILVRHIVSVTSKVTFIVFASVRYAWIWFRCLFSISNFHFLNARNSV